MKGTFNHIEHYVCECGKEFEDGQSFNGHKSHCRVHYLAKYGNDEAYIAMNKAITDRILKGSLKNQAKKLQAKAEANAAWVAARHKCKTCGKIMTDKYGSGIYCSRSCANTRKHSEETKQKITESVRKTIKTTKLEQSDICLENYQATHVKKSPVKRYCRVCNKIISNSNKTGLCITCLHNTPEGKTQMITSGKQGYATMCKNGTHKPWQSRNITSFAEQFWEKVLNNNNIPFSREVVVPHDKSNYFLDFLIEVNGKLLDLEIDGKQHRYVNRIASDKKRDAYLRDLGYIIYRIPWNAINKESGKIKMQEKINKFLAFYTSI